MEVRDHRTELIERTRAAVTERLTKEINHGTIGATIAPSESAGQSTQGSILRSLKGRADELQVRLQNRCCELNLEAQLSPLPPVALGGAVIVPAATPGFSFPALPRHH